MSAAHADGAFIETDAVVVGAGPVGLFQVFELGLHELHAHVIDSLAAAGGQCVELYADKPIYDIPGTPACTARELIDRLLVQVEPFHPQFHFDQVVTVVRREADGRFGVETSAGLRFVAKAIFIASGVGSFQPRRLKIDGIAAFEGGQLAYRAVDADALAGQRVLVIGDGDAALDCAIGLATDRTAREPEVTLMHRRDEFKADPSTVAELMRLRAANRIRFVAAQPAGFESEQGRLTALTVLCADGSIQAIPIDMLLVLTGLSPRLGPIADWGLALERKQLVVDTEKFQTSEPGIFAVGDVNTYPGKRKLILSGFHEAALAAFGAAAQLAADQPVHLEYTTTSPRLLRLLGRTA